MDGWMDGWMGGSMAVLQLLVIKEKEGRFSDMTESRLAFMLQVLGSHRGCYSSRRL